MNKTSHTLYQAYQALPQAEQQILQVLSVIFEPQRQGIFQDILKALVWKNPKGETLAALMIKPLREKLLDLSLITYEQAQLQCNLSIIDRLTVETLQNNTFDTILLAVRQKLPLREKEVPHYIAKQRPHYLKGLIRIALHQNDEASVLKLIHVTSLNAPPPPAMQVELLTELCEQFFINDEQLFYLLPDNIKYYALASRALTDCYALANSLPLALMEDTFPKMAQHHEGAACVLAELRMMQGQFVAAEALLNEIGSYHATSLLAWLVLLQGETEKSQQLYEIAIAQMKKTTKKRIVYITGVSGFFHLIALLSSGKKHDCTLALQQIKTIENTEPPQALQNILNQFRETAAVQQGEKEADDVTELRVETLRRMPIPQLLQALQLVWLKQSIPLTLSIILISHHEKAQALGLDWYTWQLEQLLLNAHHTHAELNNTVSDYIAAIKPLTLDFYDLSKTLTLRKPWEFVLDALDEISTPHTEQKTTGTQEKNGLRMTWRLNEHTYIPEPREQRLSKNGKWTKGRKVALQRLYDERNTYDYLTQHDQQICQHIKEHSYYDYGYMRSDYEIERNEALLAAVGHPLIFMENDLNIPIEVIKEEPCLIVKEKGKTKNLHLQLVPYSQNSIVIKQETSKKLSIIEYQTQHQQIAEILGEKGVTIPKQAKQKVMDRISQLAPLLTIHSDIAINNSQIETVEAQQTLHIHIQPIDDTLDNGIKFSAYIQPFHTEQPLFHPGEGGATVFTEIEQQQVQTHRDLKVETKKFNAVLQQCPALYHNSDYEWYIEDPETALETLMQLQALEDNEIQLEWPKGKKIRLSKTADLSQMHISVRKQQDWFSVTGELQIDDDNVIEMRRLMALLAQSSGRFVPLGDNKFLALTDELRSRLDAMQSYTSNKGRFHNLAVPAIDELSEGMQVKASKPWKDQLARLQEARTLDSQLPSTLQAELRDYQQEGFQWLTRLAHWGAGACLADDMGLGKTVQALALILTRCKQGATLILAPTSVCSNWETEAFRFAPTLNVKRFGDGDRQKMLDEAGAFDLIICSYGLLQHESERLAEVQWHTVVADEAQAIKNPQAKRTKAAMQLQSDFSMITTGTPIENHLGELWSLFNFINSGLLGSLKQFNQRYATPIEANNDTQARERLRNLISPFILRRLKANVLTELPPRTEITLKVSLSKEERALYEAVRQQAIENIANDDNPEQQKRMKILAEIMRLRRTCCNPRLIMPESNIASSKLEAFAEILHDLRDNQHKALVFSQFVGHLALVRDYLDQQNIHYQYLDGSTPAKKRQRIVNDFQAGEGDVFLISLKAGGSGLNLTAADYVIHLDPWWNPAVEDQASDRAHRMGQQRPVTVYRLVAENTIEEKIVGLHHQKRDLADSLLEGTEMSGKLSVDDIVALLKDH